MYDTIVFSLSVDGGPPQDINFNAANMNQLAGLFLIGNTFSFMQSTTDLLDGTHNPPNPSFYVSALAYVSCSDINISCAPPPPPVPIPAAFPLLASGLAGLGFLGRRKRKATATVA